jgi:C4-dicarboxylate transporter DctM subunit
MSLCFLIRDETGLAGMDHLILIGILCIVLLLMLMAISVPVGLCFILSGILSTYLIFGFEKSLSLLMASAYNAIAAPSWAAIPLYILLGSLAVQSDFATRAYRSVDAIAARLPGSIGITTCFGCAAFGAISGSSVAASAIFGKMVMPEMRRLGYDNSFASAIVGSAGNFASLIPPSTLFIIYALFTNTSVAKLFFAGIIPGLLTAFVFSVYIYFRAKNDKEMASRQAAGAQIKMSTKERVTAVLRAWPILLVGFIILWGIYSGVFTPTEAAAVASILVLLVGLFQGKYRKFGDLTSTLRESASTTAMLFLINIGAMYYGKVLVLTRLPAELTSLLVNLDVPRMVILLLILVVLFILGMIMVPIGIFAMVLPIVTPIVTSLGYDLIWFGVIAVKMMGIGAVTPPVGLNIYALKGAVGKDITLNEMFRGIWPFVVLDFGVLVLLTVFPQLATWLPNLLFG